MCCGVLCAVHRFWGTPIPIWASEDGEEIRVIGSIEELSQVAGRPVSEGPVRE
jgi:isoleucyl-tRNA synthetase